MVKSDKCMGVSQLLVGRGLAAPKSTPICRPIQGVTHVELI